MAYVLNKRKFHDIYRIGYVLKTFSLFHVILVNSVFPEDNAFVDPKLAPPSDEQTMLLRKVVLGGLADHVARKAPGPPPGAEKAEVKRLKGAFHCMQIEDLSYIHPESALFRNTQVEFVVYQSMMESSKLYMRGEPM